MKKHYDKLTIVVQERQESEVEEQLIKQSKKLSLHAEQIAKTASMLLILLLLSVKQKQNSKAKRAPRPANKICRWQWRWENLDRAKVVRSSAIQEQLDAGKFLEEFAI